MTERRPLTHHEILRLVEPFTRNGRHVDLAASDRIKRRLAFKPIVHDSETPGFAGASEILHLEDLRANVWRLTRTVTLATGETAKVTTDGADAGELLDRVATVSLESQFKWVGDVVLARSYRLEPGEPMLVALSSAEARLDGLTFNVKPSTVKGYPAEIELSPQADQPPENLPEDLLAALGWNWRVLRPHGTGWIGTLRTPGREPDRSRRIEAVLETAVAHLARTFSEPPRQFHERLVRARWGVVFRRMIPLLVAIALLAGAVGMVFVDIPQDSPLALLLFNAPPVLLGVLFTMNEIPRLEIPPPPRPSSAPSWFPPQAGAEAQAVVPSEV